MVGGAARKDDPGGLPRPLTSIAADTIEAAEALAAQYGMGRIVGPAAHRAAKKVARRARPIGVWCDITQSWDIEPSSDYRAVARALLLEEQDPSSAPAALGRNGGPARLTSDERAAFEAACKEAA